MSDPAVFLRDVKAGGQALEAKGVIRTAAQGGLEGQAVIKLAQRLKPQELLNFDQAIIELESAVGIALDVIARGERGTNLDAFINAVIARVAEETKRGDFESGARAVDDALAELDRREADETLRRSRIALLEQGVRIDTLRRDAVAVAARIEAIVAIDHPNQRPAELPAFLEQYGRFYEEGEAKGINFSLSVAIELARRMVATAHDAAERGTGENLLGLALCRLGGRGSGTGKLEEAVAAYLEALKERTRERVPLDWAMTQHNLGAALQALGERESGTARLTEAVAAYRAALEEFTRKRVPLQWATTQNNLVNALLRLGEHESGTGKLEEAVAAYREALKERTRERVPLDWATAQNNLGNALETLGERESGTGKLEEAIRQDCTTPPALRGANWLDVKLYRDGRSPGEPPIALIARPQTTS